MPTTCELFVTYPLVSSKLLCVYTVYFCTLLT